MNNDHNENTEEAIQKEFTAELIADTEHVCVPLDRYDQLVAAENTLGIIQKACNNMSDYQVTDFLTMLLKERKTTGDTDA